MKNTFLLVCILIFGLFSCDNEPKIISFAEKPNNLLSHKKMKTVLTEIHLAEAQIQFLKINSLDTGRAIFNEFQKKIFLKNKIDSLDFDKSYEYYVRSLQMDSIYKQVADTMKVIIKNKTFGHEILPRLEHLDEVIELDTTKQDSKNPKNKFKKKIKKIPATELT